MTDTNDIKADSSRDIWLAALRWQVEAGVDDSLACEPVDKTALQPVRAPATVARMPDPPPLKPARAEALVAPLGTSDARDEAIRLAGRANSLEELREAIAGFDGVSLKKTATNLVFSSGNPKAQIMLVGDVPGDDEDRLGEAFAGPGGELLDRILASIGLSRSSEDPAQAVYMANLFNWRPPGNRTPAPGEIEVSLPFIERHIALVRPKLVLMVGGVAAKALLGRREGISKLRQVWHSYSPSEELAGDMKSPVPALVTYHPSVLLASPGYKRAVWQDMIMLQKKSSEAGFSG